MASASRPSARKTPDLRRTVPSLDSLLRAGPGKKGCEKFGRPLMKWALQDVLGEVRAGAAKGRPIPEEAVVMAPSSRG